MSVKAIGNPIFEYTCDLCSKEDRGKWIPENWAAISIAVFGGGTGQLHICQECITDCAIAMLINKVNTTRLVMSGVDSDS
jgi:hypothetical protein